jgi:hypothetical protein
VAGVSAKRWLKAKWFVPILDAVAGKIAFFVGLVVDVEECANLRIYKLFKLNIRKSSDNHELIFRLLHKFPCTCMEISKKVTKLSIISIKSDR